MTEQPVARRDAGRHGKHFERTGEIQHLDTGEQQDADLQRTTGNGLGQGFV